MISSVERLGEIEPDLEALIFRVPVSANPGDVLREVARCWVASGSYARELFRDRCDLPNLVSSSGNGVAK